MENHPFPRATGVRLVPTAGDRTDIVGETNIDGNDETDMCEPGIKLSSVIGDREGRQ